MEPQLRPLSWPPSSLLSTTPVLLSVRNPLGSSTLRYASSPSQADILTHGPLQIYSSTFQKAFNDITNGTNPGCGTEGFSAQPGWDPVTGVGTPNFPKLLALWLLKP